MIAFLADEDFNGRIIRGLLRRLPELDLVTVTSSGLGSSPDPDVLEWAAQSHRVLLTHDRNTMTGYARDRISAALPMPGMIVVPRKLSIGAAISDLMLIAIALDEDEIRNQIGYLPL